MHENRIVYGKKLSWKLRGPSSSLSIDVQWSQAYLLELKFWFVRSYTAHAALSHDLVWESKTELILRVSDELL